jgi:hypothetical protein
MSPSPRRKSSGGRKPYTAWDQDFRCVHCKMQVASRHSLSGVRNRNHCPHCLYSRHVDEHTAGDRLSACQGEMKPVALTLKKTRKKYGDATGELMLVHICQGCGKVSINRIAADDEVYQLLAVLDGYDQLDERTLQQFAVSDIQVLQPSEREIVLKQLLGTAKL